MAIFTHLTQLELSRICDEFELGGLVEARFIPFGSINTNAMLDAASGRFFLRHTTVRSEGDLEFEAALLQHLAVARFPAPVMRRARSGLPFVAIAGGRACVFDYLAGEEVTRPGVQVAHCEALGVSLARLHEATRSFTGERPNPYGRPVVRGWLSELRAGADSTVRGAAAELWDILEASEAGEHGLLPSGVIHADLFMDNVKWIGERVSSLFDFEMACQDALVRDVAITVNAWCYDRGYVPALCRALLRGYQAHRPLEQGERAALRAQMMFGAVRFASSRIRDFHLSGVPAERLAPKDYRTYLERARALSAMTDQDVSRLVGL